MQEQSKSILSYFTDYRHIHEGLRKLNITTPLDFQEQLLQIPQNLDNLIISAPEGSGKVLAIVLLSLKKFFNEETGILAFVCHSKELSQNIHYLLSSLCKIDTLNLFMKKIDHLSQKAILIGSPLQFSTISKQYKQKVIEIVVPEADVLFSFGYGQGLVKFAQSLNHGIFFKLTCVERSAQLMDFKEKFMKKTVKIDYEPAQLMETEVKVKKNEQMITHFFEVGEKIFLPIGLYVSLKFNLVNPKILVLCQNLREVYRYFMLLERCHIPNVGLYNHEDPINLKFYTLSLWMNRNVNVLLATAKIIDELSNNTFKDNCLKQYKKKRFDLYNMTTIISINVKHLEGYYQHMVDLFHSKPFVMTFLENREQEIVALKEFIKFEESSFETVKKKELPITKKELDAFRYRINDLWMVLGNNKIEQYKQLDFKKKMLKSPDLKSYFAEKPKQREVLVKEINKLRKKIDSDGIKVSAFVPQYLVPECLKAAYEEKMKEVSQKFKNDDSGPQYQKKIKRVLRHIDIEDQNPQTTQVSRLKLISARKRWKLQHGFKLKKRNLRNQKKGIFETS